MARVDLAQFKLARADIPGSKQVGIQPFEVTPSFPSPLAEFLADSFSQFQLQLGLALDESRKYPYFRAVLAEKVLTAVETYFTKNAIRSDALANFVAMGLIYFSGKDRFFGDMVWKDITIAAHYREDPIEDAAPSRPMIKEVPIPQDDPKLTEALQKVVAGIKVAVADVEGEPVGRTYEHVISDDVTPDPILVAIKVEDPQSVDIGGHWVEGEWIEREKPPDPILATVNGEVKDAPNPEGTDAVLAES